MDEYTGKRVVSGLGVSRKGPGLAFRDASIHEDQSVQYCNRLGCSTRLNSFKGSQTGSPDRVKSSRPVFRSASGKAMVGSSSKTYSSVSSLRKSHQEPQKFSSHKETNPAEASSMQGKTEISEFIPSTSSVHGGLPEPDDAESRVLKVFPADTSEEGGSYSVTSNTRPRKQIHQRSDMCNQETSLGSSDRQSFMSRNTSQFAKPIYGQGANTSKYGLRNLGCTSVSDVLPSGCSSSVSNRSRRTDVKRRSLDGESSATSGKSMSGSSTGSSGAQRNSFSGPSLSISERSSSQQASRRARNWLSGRDGVTSVRTRRTMNGDTRTRFSEPGNGNGYNLSPSESLGLNSQLPETEMPTSGTTPPNSIQQFPAELPSNQQNSYGRPGSSRDLRSRLIAHPEDGMTRSFHGFSMDRDGFRRFNTNAIAEVLLALERIEQDEELTYEQLLVLDTNLFLGGLSFLDQHRDMRLDIDNMSYEELLALEEKMGTVSTALTEEALSNCLKRSCYMPEPPDSGSIDCGVDDVKCSICQEEYVVEDELGTLGCEHRYHVECIQQWLQQKNWCAICKAPAAPS